MKSITLDSFINERIEENKELFSKEELQLINRNRKCINKIYLLGAKNGRDCYKLFRKKSK